MKDTKKIIRYFIILVAFLFGLALVATLALKWIFKF